MKIPSFLNIFHKSLQCQKYWQKNLKHQKLHRYEHDLTHAFDLPEINRYLISGDTVKFRQPVQKIIAKTDFEQKIAKPLNTPLTLWRGIPDQTDMENKLFQKYFDKCYKLETNDIITMPEYAFTSISRGFAEFFSHTPDNKRGILFKIKVPKGVSIGTDKGNYIFPRHSKFQCTSTEIIETPQKHYKLITLDYIPNDVQKITKA